MQAIETRYHGPTDYRGSRVSAQCEAGKVTLSWEDAWNVEENHKAAALALIHKLGWTPDHGYASSWHFGSPPNHRGFVFVADHQYARLDLA